MIPTSERKARFFVDDGDHRPTVIDGPPDHPFGYFDDRVNAHAACALLNLGFSWSDGLQTSVQPLILNPAPKE